MDVEWDEANRREAPLLAMLKKCGGEPFRLFQFEPSDPRTREIEVPENALHGTNGAPAILEEMASLQGVEKIGLHTRDDKGVAWHHMRIRYRGLCSIACV